MTVGLPFTALLAVGTYGISHVLQPKYEAQRGRLNYRHDLAPSRSGQPALKAKPKADNFNLEKELEVQRSTSRAPAQTAYTFFAANEQQAEMERCL